jgi:thiamine monophosphate synthase
MLATPHGSQHRAAVIRQLLLPVLAIGGVELANVSRLLDTGASGHRHDPLPYSPRRPL